MRYEQLSVGELTLGGSLTNVKFGKSTAKATLLASYPKMTMDLTCAATTGSIRADQINLTMTAEATANQIEVIAAILTSDYKTGAWANAILGKIDYNDTGLAHGLAGVICAELDLPGQAITRGQYGCFEAELNVPTGCSGLSNPTSFMIMNAWGAAVAQFQASGFVFDITGLGTPASSHIIQANTDQPTHAIRVRIDGTSYFMLMTNVDNGTE